MRESSVSVSNSVKLDNLTLAVNTMQSQVSNTDEVVNEIREDVKVLRKAIYGNGDVTAGIMGRLSLMEEWKSSQIWFQRLIVGTLVGEGIGLGILVIHTIIDLLSK